MSEGVPGPSMLPESASIAPVPAEPSPTSSPWPRGTIILAGLVATVLTGAGGEATADWFSVAQVKNPLAEIADLSAYNRAEVRNAMLAYGLQGALLGLTFGLAGGLSRRSGRGGVIAGLTGLAIGGLAGVAASYGLFSAYFALSDLDPQGLIASILSHVGVWAAVGACSGLAFAMGQGAKRSMAAAVGGGLLGGGVGGAVHASRDPGLPARPVPTARVAAAAMPRLLAHATVDLLAAAGVAIMPALIKPGRRTRV